MLVLLATALGVALLTWLVGWWGVVIAALVAGAALWARRGVAWLVALASVAAWSALLVVDAFGGRLGRLAASTAGAMALPSFALVIVTLLFAGLLGWSAAVVGSEVARMVRERRATP